MSNIFENFENNFSNNEDILDQDDEFSIECEMDKENMVPPCGFNTPIN